MELTNTNVRYLLTIYHLSQARLEVSSKDIARPWTCPAPPSPA